MAVCSKCGGALEQNQRFCGACGTSAVRNALSSPSVPPPSAMVGGGTKLISQTNTPAPSSMSASKTDPFAQTVLGQQLDASLPSPQVPQSVSPMASSVMATPAAIAQAMARPPAPTQAPIRTSAPPPQASEQARLAVPQPRPPVYEAPPDPQRAPPPPPFGPGSAVLVLWGDGQRYPGKVMQASGQQALVVFPNGAQHWIDLQWISVGGQ
jgi:hypothetical protein